MGAERWPTGPLRLLAHCPRRRDAVSAPFRVAHRGLTAVLSVRSPSGAYWRGKRSTDAAALGGQNLANTTLAPPRCSWFGLPGPLALAIAARPCRRLVALCDLR